MSTVSEDESCPLCCEPLDDTDRRTQLCECGYQLCAFCYQNILDNASRDLIDPRCPGCRCIYTREKVRMVELDAAECALLATSAASFRLASPLPPS